MPRMAFDEKLAYVESVLDVMLESRFGPGYSYSYIERPETNAADEPVSFLELIEDECVVRHRALQRPARSKGIGLSPTTATRNKHTEPQQTFAPLFSNLSRPDLARGSPKFHRE